jgi:hypothetical protein
MKSYNEQIEIISFVVQFHPYLTLTVNFQVLVEGLSNSSCFRAIRYSKLQEIGGIETSPNLALLSKIISM